MGWWGHDVLSGDPPLDMLADLADLLGLARGQLDVYPDRTIDDPAAVAAVDRLLSGSDAVAAVAGRLAGRYGDTAVARQVLGVVAMAAGAPLDDDARALLRTAASDDRWAATDPGRRAAMDRYAAALAAYDGTPTAVPSATLADASARADDVGHTGLLNLHPPDPDP